MLENILNLYDYMKETEVSNQWRVKNPYSFESENVMTPDQRKYLKKILFKNTKTTF